MARLPVFLLLLPLLAAFASASAPTFCKCTCFKNSTIIPLGPNAPQAPPPPTTHDAASSNPPPPPVLASRAPSASCSQCNRAACLSYNLPFCREAEEKDVVAMCFQRDSRKDQIIVWGFLLGTAGLLGWAAVRRVMEAKAVTGLSVAGLGIVGGPERTGFGGGGGRRASGQGSSGGGGGGGGGGGVFAKFAGLFQRRGTGDRGEPSRGAYSPVGSS